VRIVFIGDIVGKPGRDMIKEHLKKIKEDRGIDFVIANGENASHGFGLSAKNADELLSYGVDCITGGNHIWDKKDIIPLLDSLPIVRPLNYPKGTPGKGVKVFEIKNKKIAVINLMGHFTMPFVDNVFLRAKEEIRKIKEEGIENIFIDFHAEATSEKRAMFLLFKNEVSVICGTHTHIGTDDLMIDGGTFYVSDVGLSGCRDGIIGMDEKAPIKRFLTGLPASFDISKRCKKILQLIIVELKNGKCKDGYKLKIYDDRDNIDKLKAMVE